MSSVRILHTADFHMDSPFEALSSSKAAARRRELRQLPGKIARIAVKEKVDMIMLSGDILDSDSFFAETGEELFGVLGNLPMPVFIAPGNHDYFGPKSPYARTDLPANIYIFSGNQIEFFDFSELGFRVFGAAFTDKSAPSLLRRFTHEKKDGVIDVMCIHGEVVAKSGESKYNPVTVEQIEASGMNYIGFGHNHSYSGLKKAGKTFYSWPGCPEGRGFDETGIKSVNIVDISESDCSIHPVAVSSRIYEDLDIDVTDRDPLLAVQMDLPDETVRDIYRITLKGETYSPIDLTSLADNLSQYFFELVLRDKTHIRSDIWERAGDDTLCGTFLAKMRVLYDDAKTDSDKLKIEKAVRWGIAALENREEVVRHEN